LTLGVDGNLYGIAEGGGAGNNGTLFALILSDPAPVLQTVKKTNSTVSLTWSAVAGRIYQVQFNTNLAQNAWSNLGTQIAATNSTATATDPIAQATRRFYRVVMLP